MRKLLLIIFVLSAFAGFSQSTVTITHLNYITVYDTVRHYPVMVTWWATKAKVDCSNKLIRINPFAPDPKLPKQTSTVKDYVNSGYDKGHMSECEINLCQGLQIEKECFLMSNMAPQFHALNAGSWKTLEGNSRKLALENDSIHIWAGSLGEVKKIGRVSVPAQCWKVLYIKKTGEYKAYLFQNTRDDSGNGSPETTVQYIEQLTGLTF